MRRKLLKAVLRYGITVFIGAAIALTLAWTRQGEVRQIAQPGVNQTLWCLSDGCFVAGLMLTGVGVLVWVSSTGFFDIFSYAMRSLLVLFTPLRSPEKHERFIDYKTRRAEKRRPAQWFLLIVGVVYLALAAVFMGLM